MDKQLKDLKSQFEKSIPTSFTSEDKNSVLYKIKYNNKKSANIFKHLYPKAITVSLVTVLVVIGFVILNSGESNIGNLTGTNADPPPSHTDKNPKDGEGQNSEHALTVGGNSDPVQYPSNSKLHMAHIMIASITYNTTFDNSGEPITHGQFKDSLNQVKVNLNGIKYDGEKEAKLQKAIDLTDQAIEENAEKGDPILDDIHQIVHELLEHFNGKAEDIKVDETGIPLNEEDRLPGFDYSNR